MREQRRLTLKYACGTLNRCRLGLSFLGFRVFPGRLLLTDRRRRRFVRKIGAYDLALADGLMTEAEYQRRSTALFSLSRSRLAGTKSDNGTGLVASGERPAPFIPIGHVMIERGAA